MTNEQLGKMVYSEYDFRAAFLCEQQAESDKKRLISAAYTAWQICGFNGLKTSWGDYLKMLKLVDDSPIDIPDFGDVIKRIAKRMGVLL